MPQTKTLFASVIVPVRHNTADLRILLKSLSEQTLPTSEFEVVVVENSSAIQNAEDAGLPHIKFLNEPQFGSYSARNRGIQESIGTVLAFIDSDCVAHPAWLERGIAAVRNQPGSVVAGEIQVFASGTKPTVAEMHQMDFAFDQATNIRHKRGLPTANLFVERHTVETVGFFRNNSFSGGDAEWSRRALSYGVQWVLEPQAIVYHPARKEFKELLSQRRRFATAVDNVDRPSDKVKWLLRWSSVRQESLSRLSKARRHGGRHFLSVLLLHAFLVGYQTCYATLYILFRPFFPARNSGDRNTKALNAPAESSSVRELGPTKQG